MQVEIWSDVVCPWCYVGKRRFERALARFPQRAEVEVLWRSFELDPSAPRRRREPAVERLAAKYGMSLGQARASNARLEALGAAEGLTLDFEATQSGNTFDAHRLLHLARARGMQGALQERLFRGYFSEGAPIGEAETLARLATEAGLDEAETRAVLASDAYVEEVRADEEQAAAYGITGVPFFVLDRRYGVSGAQSPDLFLQALERAWADAHPAPGLRAVSGDEGPSCSDEACVL